MKNLKQIIEDFKIKVDAQFSHINSFEHADTMPILDKYRDLTESFIEQSITELLESLTDDDSLEDESNGRCNREFELRSKINKILI